VKLYSPLEVEGEGDLFRLGECSTLIEGERRLDVYAAAAFDWKKLELECRDCDESCQQPPK
jgi:hypothetical protein